MGVWAVGFSLVGNLVLLGLLVLGALNQPTQPDFPGLLHLSRAESAGMRWLLDHARGEVVLAAPRTGMYLPGRAGVRVVYGHPFETIDAADKQARAEAFFRGALSRDEWRRLAAQHRIRYVFYGPTERRLGAGMPVDELELVFDQGDTSIYRVS